MELKLNWGNLKKSASPAARSSYESLQKRFDSQEVAYFSAIMNTAIQDLALSEKLYSDLKKRDPGFQQVLCIGIGGSSLGPLSLISALPKNSTALPIRFLENPDPDDWQDVIATCDPERTLVVCITKSGTTFETLAMFQLALQWLSPRRWKTHVVCITDPEKGDLRRFSQEHAIPSLPIHPGIGGRFSIFSPVGYFPALLAGLNPGEFLKGAREAVHAYSQQQDASEVFQLAASLITHYETHPTHVLMPYSSRLKTFADWFVQLWGESLGKDGKGFTPLAANGPLDQHSILQLLRDGPNDKVTCLLEVKQAEKDVKIPLDAMLSLPAFQILQGHSLKTLMDVECQAVQKVLSQQQRPYYSLEIARLNEYSLGEVYAFFALLTSVTGTLWEINPFDQPGVEEGKVYIKEALRNGARS